MILFMTKLALITLASPCLVNTCTLGVQVSNIQKNDERKEICIRYNISTYQNKGLGMIFGYQFDGWMNKFCPSMERERERER